MTNAEPPTETLADGVLRTDTSHFPVVFLSWHGEPTMDAVHASRKWLDRVLRRAEDESTLLFPIIDTSDSVIPKPEIRSAFSKLAFYLYNNHRKRILAGAIIVPGTLMRAAFIMVIAVSRRNPGIAAVKSMDHALERAFKALDEAKIDRPPSLEELVRGRSTG